MAGAAARVRGHVAAFNKALAGGDWTGFADRFDPRAGLRFVGVPAGPFHGRAAMAEAYGQSPPDDRG